MRRPAVFRAFAAFDALLVAALVFALVRAHGTTTFFDQSVTLDEQLNSTMVDCELPSHPTGVRFSFRPRASTPVLHVFWNYEQMDGDWEALRVSSLPARPSSWIVVRGGRVVETKSVAGAAGSEWTIALADGRILADVDGARVLDEPFLQRTTSIHFALAPAWVFRTLRPPWSALNRLTIEFPDRDGAATTTSKAPLWLWNIAALVAAICALCAFLALDRAACRRLLARGSAARWLTGYPLAVVLIPLAFVGFFGAWESAKRESGDLNWFQPYLRDGFFDDASFRADPALRRGGREIRVPLGGDTVVIAAHGGSTTDGYPYGRGRWDWPTRLREKIEADPDFTSRPVDVLNLGYVSDLLENNVPPGIEGFYAAVRPRIAIFHPVINNYYSRRPTEALAHGLGLWSHRARTAEFDHSLGAFLELLRAKIRLARDAGAWPVIVVPALDADAFGDTAPTNAWSDATIALASEEGAGVVDLRWAFRARARAGDILFQEFMHPNRAGYDLAADEIWRVMRENRERWWSKAGEV